MSGDNIKMSYSQNQLRVRLTFRTTYCAETPTPPQPIIKRAISKLSHEQDAGKLDLYEIYDEGLNELWQRIRAEMVQPDAKDMWVTYTIGSGAPRINEILVERADSEKVAIYLTFRGQPAFANNWAFEFVRVNVRQQMKQMNLEVQPNDAHLFSCWLRAKRGETIKKKPIGPAPQDAEDGNEKGYAVIGSKARNEVTVNVTDASVFKDTARMQGLVSSCAKAVAKLQAVTGTPLEFLKERLIDRLKSALRGPERYGIGLPASYLVGYPAVPEVAEVESGSGATVDAATGSDQAGPSALNRKPSETYLGKGLLSIQIRGDKMSAFIDEFDKAIYDHPEFTADIKWIEKEIRSAGIEFGFTDEIRSAIEKAISTGDTLEGLTVAEGQPPIEPCGPYLWEAFKEAKPIDQIGEIDLREMQQRSLVKAGDLVAEIRYEIDPKPGNNIYGEPIQPDKSDELQISLGEGIEMRGEGAYYATFDGVPEVTESSLSLSKILVHEGDVNLRSGNIRFDGPVEIKGAIDSGATVEVTGDLIVHGTIRDAHVRVGGNLVAKSGIVTGRRGMVRVRNDVYAEFLENARIICGGSITVKKVILNSNLVAGGNIEANVKTGVIAGGRISCRKFIRTAKLGFPKGSGTKVFAGVDWRAKVAVEIREDRLQSVIDINNSDRNDLRELTRKKQKTKKHVEKIKILQDRLVKTRTLLDKMKAHLQKARSEMSYDPDARVFVHDILFANIEVEIAGVSIPVTNDVAEVEISPKRQRGAFIHPLSEEELDPRRAG